MVIDEAYVLGVPVFTTRTNSSDEMITARNCGWICENNQQDLNRMLLEVLRDPMALGAVKEKIRGCEDINGLALKQFADMLKR